MQPLPWWTWILPGVICHIGTRAALFFEIAPGTAVWYPPIALSIAMAYWWGPRVFLGLYINAALSAGLWDLPRWQFWPLYGLPETVNVYLSYLLFVKWRKRKEWLPHFEDMIEFIVWGLFVPSVIGNLYLHIQFTLLGDLPAGQFWTYTSANMISDILNGYIIAIPLLVFLTPFMEQVGLSRTKGAVSASRLNLKNISRGRLLEGLIILGCFAVLSLFISLEEYWFVYGLIIIFISLRFSQKTTVLTNQWVAVWVMLLPAMFPDQFSTTWFPELGLNQLHLNLVILFSASLLISTTINDLQVEITQRKATENKIRELNEELEQRVIERTRQIAQKNQELESFSYSISHDLRAPLRAIRGFSQILYEEHITPDNTEAREYLELILRSGEKMNMLIGDLLTLSGIGSSNLSLEVINPETAAQKIFIELFATNPEREITFITSPCSPLEADPNMFNILLTNLLSNAIKFTNNFNEARIEFGSLLDSEPTVLFVRDNGIGFDMKYASKIFEPFQRLHSSEEYPGTGIGLAIVNRIIDKHDGNIWVESEPDKGATFYFSL
jgi:signal transduction histidine kinase